MSQYPHSRRRIRESIERLEDRTLLAYLVTNVFDSGAGSLRTAIQQANAHAGPDVIQFALSGSARTIQPKSPLPIITESVVLDGTTQPGFVNAPLVILDGAGAGQGAAGLALSGSSSTVRSLRITR